MSYNPGLHILAELHSDRTDLFTDSAAFRACADGLIDALQLSKVGEAYHNFPGGGFTAVICLTESHLSIHTWPEYNTATFDVFLSNFKKNNDEATRKLFEGIRIFFEATAKNYHELRR